MSNLPSRQVLNNSTSQLSSNQLPRENRVTGTVPKTASVSARKASAGLLTDANVFYITLGMHAVLIGVELWLAHKQKWI
jgi:hypothetical protein